MDVSKLILWFVRDPADELDLLIGLALYIVSFGLEIERIVNVEKESYEVEIDPVVDMELYRH